MACSARRRFMPACRAPRHLYMHSIEPFMAMACSVQRRFTLQCRAPNGLCTQTIEAAVVMECLDYELVEHFSVNGRRIVAVFSVMHEIVAQSTVSHSFLARSLIGSKIACFSYAISGAVFGKWNRRVQHCGAYLRRVEHFCAERHLTATIRAAFMMRRSIDVLASKWMNTNVVRIKMRTVPTAE